jgi:hypothetical protein
MSRYAALDRPPSQRTQDDERLKVTIKAADKLLSDDKPAETLLSVNLS